MLHGIVLNEQPMVIFDMPRRLSNGGRLTAYGSKAQSPHGAVRHLDDPSDFCIGCIHLARRSGLGSVVTEEDDGLHLHLLEVNTVVLMGVMFHLVSIVVAQNVA